MRWARRLIVAGLGVVLVIDAATGRFEVVPFVIGLIMIGLIPLDALIDLVTRPTVDDAQLDRLREVMEKRDDERP